MTAKPNEPGPLNEKMLLRLDEALFLQLRERAKSESRPLSWVVRDLLRVGLAETPTIDHYSNQRAVPVGAELRSR